MLSAGVAIVLYWPWWAGLNTLLPALNEVGGQYYFPSLPTLVQGAIARQLSALAGVDVVVAQLWVKALVALAVLGYVLWELVRTATNAANADDRGVVRIVTANSARILLVLLLAVLTEVHGWYFTWPLALVTLLGWQVGLTRLVVGYTLGYLVVDYLGAFDLRGTTPSLARGLLNLAYLGLPLAVVAALRSFGTRRITELIGGRGRDIHVAFRSSAYPDGH
jgi:hypothetical protein